MVTSHFSGTTSLAFSFVSAIIGALIAPALFTLFGFKVVVMVTNLIYVMYILANLYPGQYKNFINDFLFMSVIFYFIIVYKYELLEVYIQ